jgi:hypothetical protein
VFESAALLPTGASCDTIFLCFFVNAILRRFKNIFERIFYMKKIMITGALLALCFATGFTCSKNAPQATTEATQPATTESTTATDQSQMAAPPAGSETAPAPAGTEAQAPGATTPAPTETK